jgi:hypothetical protein
MVEWQLGRSGEKEGNAEEKERDIESGIHY